MTITRRTGMVTCFLAVAVIFWSAAGAHAEEQGKLYVVGMGPAGPDLTAPRALAIVEKADVLLCSPGMPKRFELFGSHIDPDKVAFDPWENIFGKEVRQLKMKNPRKWAAAREKQRKKVQEFVMEHINQGRTVVMMDGGDPCIYGPSLNYLLKGFDDRHVEVIPGMGAVNAAAAALKRPLTCDDVQFVLLTSPESLLGEGLEDNDEILGDLAKYKATLVFYMSLKSITTFTEKLKKYYPPDAPLAIVFYAGYAGKETVLRSTLADIAKDLGKEHEQWLGLVIISECIRTK